MTSRLVAVALGAVWVVCGALMAFNPPPHGFYRAAAIPFVGWAAMAVGTYLVVQALRSGFPVASGKPPRHASGEEPDLGAAVKFAVFYPVGGVVCVSLLWTGVAAEELSMVGLAVAGLGVLVVALPGHVSTLKWLLRRRGGSARGAPGE